MCNGIDERGVYVRVNQPVAMTWPLTHWDSGAVKQAAARDPYNTRLLLNTLGVGAIRYADTKREGANQEFVNHTVILSVFMIVCMLAEVSFSL